MIKLSDATSSASLRPSINGASLTLPELCCPMKILQQLVFRTQHKPDMLNPLAKAVSCINTLCADVFNTGVELTNQWRLLVKSLRQKTLQFNCLHAQRASLSYSRQGEAFSEQRSKTKRRLYLS